MNVYPVTVVDRELLLAGADLEAVLAERERERLEQDGHGHVRPGAGAMVQLGYDAPQGGGFRYASSRPLSA